MKALITGANGFVGGHLLRHLASETDYTLHGTRLAPLPTDADYNCTWWELDLCDRPAVDDMMAQVRPDLVFHLAGLAFVPASLDRPWEYLENNIKGQVNLFESVLVLGIAPRFLVVSSAHVYGKIFPDDNPVNETHPLRPETPYAVSKIAQDMLALQYYLTYDLPTVRARAFNHIGPGQNTQFALPSFAQQIVAIESNEQKPVISVGNLDAQRDFTDVRDVVRAYHRMLMDGKTGEVYNVCRGDAFKMADLLAQMCKMCALDVELAIDPELLRPLDIPIVIGDNTRLRQDTGWEPTIEINQSLADILEHARQNRTTT